MKYLSVIIFFIAFSMQNVYGNTPAANIKTDTLSVKGNCDMCKDRIENAALIKGVKKATWDKHTQKLTVIYDSTKTSAEKILKSIADAGHDNEKFTAPDEVYNRLPKCCAYRGNEGNVH